MIIRGTKTQVGFTIFIFLYPREIKEILKNGAVESVFDNNLFRICNINNMKCKQESQHIKKSIIYGGNKSDKSISHYKKRPETEHK